MNKIRKEIPNKKREKIASRRKIENPEKFTKEEDRLEENRN